MSEYVLRKVGPNEDGEDPDALEVVRVGRDGKVAEVLGVIDLAPEVLRQMGLF